LPRTTTNERNARATRETVLASSRAPRAPRVRADTPVMRSGISRATRFNFIHQFGLNSFSG